MRWMARRRPVGAGSSWPTRWLVLCALPGAVALAGAGASGTWNGQFLLPLLAVPPALAGIGALTPRRPLIYGAVMLVAALAVLPVAAPIAVPAASAVAVAAVTAISAAGAARNRHENRRIANVTSVAEAAQRALLRPLPSQVGPLELGVVYLAAAAEARVGGDLYEVARTQFGIRLIVGDVRGKGLEAVEIAADVLGVFREIAHEVYTLAEVARRLDASLARRPAAPLEEFVTAILAEIDPVAGSLTIYNCGHPPPLVLTREDGTHRYAGTGGAQRTGAGGTSTGTSGTGTSGTSTSGTSTSGTSTSGTGTSGTSSGNGTGVAGAGNGGNGHRHSDGSAAHGGPPGVITVDVPSPALPLRLMSLGDCSGAGRTLTLAAGDALLLYTDGVTEARDRHREFYPLTERVAKLAATANGSPADLLNKLRADLLRHVGAPLEDDAALLLVRAPSAWEGRTPQPVEAAAR
jgi:serine phosphatase RsbU (regulator of sigma subunit)